MSKPLMLVLLLVMLVATQLEWKQQVTNDIEASPGVSGKRQRVSGGEEVVKEKIILSQEKSIQQLNGFVHGLQQQLLHCQCNKNTVNVTVISPTENVNESEKQQILED